MRNTIVAGVAGVVQVAGLVIATFGVYPAVVPPVLSGLTRLERLEFASWALCAVVGFIVVGLAFRWIGLERPWRRALRGFGFSLLAIPALTFCLYFAAYALNNYDSFVYAGWVVLAIAGAAIHITVARRPERADLPASSLRPGPFSR